MKSPTTPLQTEENTIDENISSSARAPQSQGNESTPAVIRPVVHIAGDRLKYLGNKTISTHTEAYLYQDVLQAIVELKADNRSLIGLITGESATDENGTFHEITGFSSAMVPEEDQQLKTALALSLDGKTTDVIGWFQVNMEAQPLPSMEEQGAHDAYFFMRGLLLRVDTEGDCFGVFVPDDQGELSPVRVGLITH